MADATQQKRDSFLLLIIVIVVSVATLTAAAVFLKKEPIEKDLYQRTAEALSHSSIELEHLSFNGRDAALSGSISTEEEKANILALVSDVNGVRFVDADLSIIAVDVAQTQNTETAKPIMLGDFSHQENTEIVETTEAPQQIQGRFTLRHDAGKWVMAGEVADEETKHALLVSAEETIGQKVIDGIKVDSEIIKSEWPEMFLSILESFALVHGGAELTLEDGMLIVAGDVNSDAEKRMVLMPLRDAFGHRVSIKNQLRVPVFKNGYYVPTPQHPIEKLDYALIQFSNKGEANSIVSGHEVLNELISMMQSRTGVVIEVSGHHAVFDNEDENIAQSLSMALAIKDFLVKNGIEKMRVRAQGFGSQRMVTENNEVNNSAYSNQRVELKVIKRGL